MNLCHGPGCRREAVVEYFCGERCQAAWDARWAKCPPDVPAYAAGAMFEAAPVAQASVFAPGELEYYLRLVQPVEQLEPIKLTRDRSAAYPQVASEGPQVTRGWLSRLLGRMYGRGTPQ